MIKKIIKRILLKERYSSNTYVEYLRHIGIEIGKNCRIFDPKSNTIDIQNPHMITIGNNVSITTGVIILTHDYSWSVLANLYGDVLGGIGEIKIGNNVFIGMNTILLKDTIIGDNVIIGAGSIVSGKIESNSVYAGNPARKIMSIEDFYKKRKEIQYESVEKISNIIKVKYNRFPIRDELKEYFALFTEFNDLHDIDMQQIDRIGNKEKILNYISNNSPKFKSYEELIEDLKRNGV